MSSNLLPNKSTVTIDGIRVVIYLRVSSDEQVKSGLGLEGQLHECKLFIAKKFPNAEIIIVYSEDGVSAAKVPMEFRPELVRMLGDAIKAKFDVIVTFKQDRLARKVEESESIYNRTELVGVEVWEASSETRLNKATPQEKFKRQILASVAEMEVENTRDRIKATKAGQRAKGNFAGGDLPYGFLWDSDNSKIIEVEEEIRVWLQIIHKFLNENKGTIVIARELNESGISYSSGKKRDGRSDKWSKDNVLLLLKNPTICGKLPNGVVERYKDADGRPRVRRKPVREWTLQETPLLREIVPLDVWHTIIDRLESKRVAKVPPKQMATSWLLSGMVKCAHCGSVMLARDSGKKTVAGKVHRYYRCPNSDCSSILRSLRKDDLENLVLSELQEMFTTVDSREVAEIALRHLQAFHDTVDSDIDTLDAEIESLHSKMQTFLTDYTNGDLSAKAYNMAVESIEKILEEKVDQRDAKVAAHDAKVKQTMNLEVTMETLQLLTQGVLMDDAISVHRKRAAVLQLIDHVVVENGEVRIVTRGEAGSEIPTHLERAMDRQMEDIMKEVMAGKLEVSATSVMWGNSALRSHASPLRSFCHFG
ncbi:recombinase family protein [Paenibacillus sp. GP183]|uniref:recombinase family protein n=1 Tax=Paenibacillus sp. GP183 TaxID=1882751 RepID=UPI00089B7D8E|nr:recombinase family protein [Paenibacillus sp. GP183]SEB68672.1 Site-specific DNA recombinase [Paenibacillus sp. GP183]